MERDKIFAFEYFLLCLCNWHKEVTGNVDNDLSVLKVLKLLFFVTAVDSNRENSLLDTVFENFVAMPYGHVESIIYDYLKHHKELFENIEIDNTHSKIINEEYILRNISDSTKEKIDSAIEIFRHNYNQLIKMSAFGLVELSHSWYSWKYYFNKAKTNHSFSEAIPKEIIKAEEKHFAV